MSVQFNLLPDVKLEFNRAQHAKKVVYTLSFLAISAVAAITIISFLAVNVLQKQLLTSANNDINNYSRKLESIPNLDKVLTIQNQLDALPSLHQKKHITSRLFTYLPQITPSNAFIGKMTLDTTTSTLEIDGTADTVQTVNKFVDTLKFTTYGFGQLQTGQLKSEHKNAFSNVILSKVDRNTKNASYTITASFDPILFDATQNVNLVVPQETTTRSVLNSPDASSLFNGQTGNTTKQQGSQ